MDEETNAIVTDIDTRLESLQKDNYTVLYYISWYAFGIIATIVAYATVPPYGAAVGVLWVIDAIRIVAKLQKYVK